MIPIFTILFILFIMVVKIAINRADASQEEVTSRFWEREREANSTIRKDTANLRYINIPDKFFPLNNHKINDLKDATLVNLTGMSNTDIKLQYGVPNFQKLSDYDNNFTEFVILVPDYYNTLVEAGYDELALELLEFAVDIGADSKAIYQLLAASYIKQSKGAKITELITKANELNSLSKSGIISMLKTLQAGSGDGERDVPENIAL